MRSAKVSRDVAKKPISITRRVCFVIAVVMILGVTVFLMDVSRGKIRNIPERGWHRVTKLGDTGVSYYRDGDAFVLVNRADEVFVISEEELRQYVKEAGDE